MADPSPFARLPLQRSESRSSLAPPSPLATQYPHVYHYVHHLFQSAASEATTKEAHPLSVSSSTGSGSGSGSNSEDEKPKPQERKSTRTVSVSSNASATSTPSTDTQGSSKPSPEEKEETIRVIVDLLRDEKEEQVKDVLKQKLGAIGQVSFRGSFEGSADACPGRRMGGPNLPRYHAQTPRRYGSYPLRGPPRPNPS